MPQNVTADLASLPRRLLLIESVVHTAVDARIVDIVGDLLPARIVERHVRHFRAGECEGVSVLAKHMFEHASRCSTERGVPGRIARKRRREDEWCPGRVR